MESQYYEKFIAAFVRGQSQKAPTISELLMTKTFEELSSQDHQSLVSVAKKYEISIYPFKKTLDLPRVIRILGVLKGIYPQTLLDIGSGRGTFLWPLIENFPELSITSVDLNPKHTQIIEAVVRGGFPNLSVQTMNATELQFSDNQFEVVTLLEVLEHIPDCFKAVSEAVRVASRFVLLTVPSKEDENPEHIHLFNKRSLTEIFTKAGANKVQISSVLNHFIVVARCF